MTKRNKLISRLLLKPKDFTWDELAKILIGFGYKLSKRYQLENIIDLLKQEDLI